MLIIVKYKSTPYLFTCENCKIFYAFKTLYYLLSIFFEYFFCLEPGRSQISIFSVGIQDLYSLNFSNGEYRPCLIRSCLHYLYASCDEYESETIAKYEDCHFQRPTKRSSGYFPGFYFVYVSTTLIKKLGFISNLMYNLRMKNVLQEIKWLSLIWRNFTDFDFF